MLAPLIALTIAQQSLAGNVGLVGDYRFRGISQTYGQPAIQAGFEYAPAAGVYLGTWGSNVSGNQYLNGGSLELDWYGGYRRRAGPVELDAGLLYYWYPKARYNVVSGDEYNTTEAYVGIRLQALSVKYSRALSDLFGMKTGTIGGYCGINADGTAASSGCLGAGSSKGSTYLDFSATLDIALRMNLALHGGRQSVESYRQLSYWDYKVALTKAWAGLTVGVAAVGNDAASRFYRYTPTTAGSTETEDVSKAAIVLSVAKTF
jgi:Bacterial protein of unknown function (Gcw_chp)